jgi:type I restriction enzyme S subunit
MENNKPQVRFNGFDEDWISSKLGTIVDLENGFAFKSRFFQDKESTHIVLTPGNVNVGGGFQFDKGHYYNTNGEFLDKFIMKPNDIFLTMTDLTPTAQTLGFPALIPDDGYIYLHNQRLGKLINYDVDKNFLFRLLCNLKFQKQIVLTSSGTTVKHTSPTKILTAKINYPNDKFEQQKIGAFFENLDKLITEHQQKQSKLRAFKKAMLSKMFPQQGQTVPEIRFKGFSGDWDKSEFHDVFNGIPNNSLSREKLNYHSGKAKNIHYGDILVKYNEIVDLEKEVIPFISDNETVEKLKNSRLLEGDIIISDTAEDEMVGKCVEMINIKDNIVFSGLHTIAVRPKQKFAPRYLGYYMNSDSYHDQLLKLMQGTKVLSISKNAIKKTFINHPINKKEQLQLGSYFQNLDNLIAFHQIQLEKLQNMKKAFLAKMFI